MDQTCIRIRHHEGELDVPDLVRRGDWIRSSAGTDGLVLEVIRYHYHAGVDDQVVAAYSIHFWNRQKVEYLAISDKIRLDDYSSYTEVVAQDGKLCKLLEANTESFEIIPIPDDITIPARAQAFLGLCTEQGQLSLL